MYVFRGTFEIGFVQLTEYSVVSNAIVQRYLRHSLQDSLHGCSTATRTDFVMYVGENMGSVKSDSRRLTGTGS